MKKKGDDKMNAAAIRKEKAAERKNRMQASYEKAKKANGKALERLSKN